MKNLILLMSIVLFSSVLMTYQIDFNKMVQEKQRWKFISEEALSSASLNIDLWEYANGYLIYDDEQVISTIEKMILINHSKENFEYSLVIHDESGIYRNYGGGLPPKKMNLSPYLLIKINTGKPNFSCLKVDEDIYVVSMYENQGFC